nr:MAG TPA: hypothetical protein [Caudoviricetes sp.]
MRKCRRECKNSCRHLYEARFLTASQILRLTIFIKGTLCRRAYYSFCVCILMKQTKSGDLKMILPTTVMIILVLIALPIGHLISMLILRWLANPMNNRYVRFVLDSYLEDIPNKLEKSRWFTPVTKEVDVEILDTNGNVESLLKGECRVTTN